jgi:hypothetical protein
MMRDKKKTHYYLHHEDKEQLQDISNELALLRKQVQNLSDRVEKLEKTKEERAKMVFLSSVSRGIKAACDPFAEHPSNNRKYRVHPSFNGNVDDYVKRNMLEETDNQSQSIAIITTMRLKKHRLNATQLFLKGLNDAT